MFSAFRERHPRLNRWDRALGAFLGLLMSAGGVALIARQLGAPHGVVIATYVLALAVFAFGVLRPGRSRQQRERDF